MTFLPVSTTRARLARHRNDAFSRRAGDGQQHRAAFWRGARESRFRFLDDCVEACIADDGNGFDASSMAGAPDGKRGLGLMEMQERIGLIDGKLRIQSKPGKGARIAVTVPFKPPVNQEGLA